MSIRDFRYDADPLAACRAEPALFPYLLQSAARAGAQGRYDLLLARPDPVMLVLGADGTLRGPYAAGARGDFFAALDAWWQAERRTTGFHDGLPFQGGWFVYLGYEMAAQVEQSLVLRQGRSLPLAFAARVPAALVRDHETQRAWFVCEDGHADALFQYLESACRVAAPPEMSSVLSSSLAEEEPGRYLDQVQRARRYILDGDIFQANLSRRWSADLDATTGAVDLFARLRHANPGPFAGLALHGDAAVISSSPERLVRVMGDRVEARPIAGTRPRGVDPEQDAALIRELIGHPKERAEHVMLLDMERNDLGRVAETGSVKVDELMVVESYTHVHHIVSNVCGRLRAGVTPGQVIRAVFPGGTITGCPKVRCMEIIAELEQAPREAYTGAMGYLGRDGSMDLNILIRTLVQKDRALSFRAGAGIVADSVPERELDETRAKARGLARALGADS